MLTKIFIISLTFMLLNAAHLLRGPKIDLQAQRAQRDVVDICDSIMDFHVRNVSMGDRACKSTCYMNGYNAGSCVLRLCTCNNEETTEPITETTTEEVTEETISL